ncbi:MAG: hypothetical protein ISR60_08925 [Anaerolineales bacterium]|nr:hypothetical protein [Anaerolineales bacterium]
MQEKELLPVSQRYTRFHYLLSGLVAAAVYALGTWLSLELRIPGEIPPPIAPILSLLSTPGILLNYALHPPAAYEYQISYFLGSLIFWFITGYFSLKIAKRVWLAALLGVGFAILIMILGFGILLFAMRGMSP